VSKDSDELREELQRVVSPRYEVREEIGHGGMAFVYRGSDREDGRALAFKVLKRQYATLLGPTRFLREIRLHSHLHHPGILPLLHSGHAGGLFYFIMPLVDGETLQARLDREPQLPLELVRRVVTQVAAALDYAHDAGVVHRDIKPSNLFLSGGQVLLADFGIAKDLFPPEEESTTSTGLVVGTVQYMSPEQADGNVHPDRRTDVYSLGCVAYQMLAGEPPFTGANTQAVLARVRSLPAPSARLLRPELPRGVDAVIRKALAKSPADRYQRAGDFASALSDPAQLAAAAREAAREEQPGRRWLAPVAVGLCVLALAALLLLPPRRALDRNKVMGFPLAATGGIAPTVVEQVEEAIAVAMQDTDPLRWVQARLFLGSGARGGLPADSATWLARQRGARYWLSGSLSRIGDSLAVRLDLFDAEADSLIDSRSETGPPSTPPYALAFRAVNALLPKIVGRSTQVDERYLTRHLPAAVAKWLEGEVAYRNARYTDALGFYREALAADSTLVPAALKGAMTSAWLNQYPAGDLLVRLALRRENDLPPLNRMFARGLQYQFAGNGDSALAWFRQVANAAPEWSEGWYGIGEATYHLWPAGSDLDSLARDAFQRSLALDPDFAPVVFHLAELTLAAGELGDAARLVARHRALSADTVQQLQLETMLQCIRGGPDAVAWTSVATREEPALQLLTAGRLLAAGGRHLDCAEGAYRAALLSPAPDTDLSRRWNAGLGLHHLFVARGETARARRLADSLASSGVIAGRGLRVLEALLGAGPDSAGAAEIAALDIPLERMSRARLWWFGEWSAQHGDTLRLAAIAGRLRHLADSTGQAADQVPARVMAARLLLLRGDSSAATDSLLAIHPVAPLVDLVWNYWDALAPERLLLARLLLARGRAAEAEEVGRWFDGQRTAVDVAFLPASLELRRSAAARLGSGDLAETYGRRLIALSRR
jgi:serine/threonine-protein kinase